MDDVQSFYDGLAADYHRMFPDWWRSVERQGEALGRLIEARLGAGPKRVLDGTAGIGTQALGLSLLGHEVLATDLSESATQRGQREAESRGLSVRFQQWDVREIADLPGGPFDVVVSADNSLPHLVDLDDLERAVRGLWAQTTAPGLILVSTRDYDRLLEERPQVDGPRVLGERGQRCIVFQLWHWHPDEPLYEFEHLMFTETEQGWQGSPRSCLYRALPRAELERCFQAAGATEWEWFEPSESGFFQPLLCVTRNP